MGIARDEYGAVRLHRDTPAIVVTQADRRCDDAIAAAEAGVQVAIGIVAYQREISACAVDGIAGNEYAAVGLHRDAQANVVRRTEVGRNDAIAHRKRWRGIGDLVRAVDGDFNRRGCAIGRRDRECIGHRIARVERLDGYRGVV